MLVQQCFKVVLQVEVAQEGELLLVISYDSILQLLGYKERCEHCIDLWVVAADYR